MHTHATPARADTQKYVILIAFLWKKWFRERASKLRLKLQRMSCSVSGLIFAKIGVEPRSLQVTATPHFYYKNNTCLCKVLHVSTLKIHHDSQITKRERSQVPWIIIPMKYIFSLELCLLQL
jgi:hypothetical protein